MAKPIGTVRADLHLNSASFERNAAKARRTTKSLGKRLSSLRAPMLRLAATAAVAGGAIAAMTARSLRLVDAQAKVADRLGLSTEALAGLQLQAKLTGVSTKTLDTALQRMVRRFAEVETTGKGVAKNALKSLGIAIEDIKDLAPEKQFELIADSLEGVDSQSKRVLIAMQLFDTEGVSLLNTLAGGSEALQEAQRKALAYGTALTRIDAAKIEQANDALTEAKEATNGLANRFGVGLSPVITAVATKFSQMALESEGFRDITSSAVNSVTVLVGFLADRLQDVILAFNFLKASSVGLIGLARLSGEVIKGRGGDLEKIRTILHETDTDLMRIKAVIDRLGGDFRFSDAIAAEIEKAAAAAEAKAAEIEQRRKALAGGGVDGIGADTAAAELEKKRQQLLAERMLEQDSRVLALEGLKKYLATDKQLRADALLERLELVSELENNNIIREQEAYNLRMDIARKHTAELKAEELKRGKQQAAVVANTENVIRREKIKTVQMAIGLLQLFGRENKAFAIAAVALNKALAIAQVIQNTAANVTKVFPDAAAMAAAATLGKIQLGIIAATGLGEIAQIASGSGAVGGIQNPAYTTSADNQQQQQQTQQPTEINVSIDGSGAVRSLMEEVFEQITDGAGGDFRIKVLGG